MSTQLTQQTQLRRAHAQSEVIQANLEHLKGVLSDAAPSLQSDLQAFEKGFKLYVGRLGDAVRADTERAPA